MTTDNANQSNDKPETDSKRPNQSALTPVVLEHDYETLSDGQSVVHIRLGSEVYTLRRTQSGKLLLNK